ncbi:MAG: PilW family protein [Betaproteobacteria bacterium]
MNAARSRGMGLVELLVWVAISLVITSVIGTVYVNSKQLTRVNDTISRLQESGRFVIHLIDRDLRMAGFRGCNGLAVTPLNVLNSATSYAYKFDTGLQGFYGYGGSWSPSLDSSISALTPSPAVDSDVITIRHIDGPGVPLTARMLTQTDDLTVAAGSGLAGGDILLVADCTAAAIFNASAYNAASGMISHAAGGGAPGNSASDLGHVFGTEASVYRLVTRTYFVAPSVKKSGTSTLWSYSVPAYDGQPQPEEMVEGVDRLAVQFGEDLDGDRAANRYTNAAGVSTWNNVVSIKAQVLLATVRDNMATASQPYTFNGVTTTPTDKKMRTALSSVITVRNRVP